MLSSFQQNHSLLLHVYNITDAPEEGVAAYLLWLKTLSGSTHQILVMVHLWQCVMAILQSNMPCAFQATGCVTSFEQHSSERFTNH